MEFFDGIAIECYDNPEPTPAVVAERADEGIPMMEGFVRQRNIQRDVDSDLQSDIFGSASLVTDVSEEILENHSSFDAQVAEEPMHGHADNADTAVRQALQLLEPPDTLQVWEQGIWSCIFADRPIVDVYRHVDDSLVRPLPSAWNLESAQSEDVLPAEKRPRVTASKFHDVVIVKTDYTWQEQQDAQLQSALKVWRCLIARWCPDCELVLQIDSMPDETSVLEMLADIFSGRSPLTVKKRGLALARICDYLDDTHGELFPCSEKSVYAFFKHEQQRGAPASRLSGYLQALTFARFVLQVEELNSVISSARCRGAARSKEVRDKKQASPLTVNDVKKLHMILESAEDLWERLFCGACLFTIYARGRWGDLCRCDMIIPDMSIQGELCYLEARTGKHKTLSAAQHRHQFLPMVATCIGLSDRNWGSIWLDVRCRLNIKLPPYDNFMPAPDQDGVATRRPLETKECGLWLRKILLGHTQHSSVKQISSHSMKTTVLSWAAKRGYDVPLRLQMGYHCNRMQMAMTYSRDAATASIMAVQKLIDEIKSGVFAPDDTRSGRLIDQDKNLHNDVIVVKDEDDWRQPIEIKDDPLLPVDLEAVHEIQFDSDDFADSSSSSSSQSGDDRELFRQPSDARFRRVEAPPGFVLWQHRKIHTLHLMDVGNVKVFECGRSVGPNHTKIGVTNTYDTPICKLCFTHAQGN